MRFGRELVEIRSEALKQSLCGLQSRGESAAKIEQASALHEDVESDERRIRILDLQRSSEEAAPLAEEIVRRDLVDLLILGGLPGLRDPARRALSQQLAGLVPKAGPHLADDDARLVVVTLNSVAELPFNREVRKELY